MIRLHHLYSDCTKQFSDEDQGASLIETALVLPVILLLLVAAIDFGGAYTASITVNAAAEAGALYGIQNPSDATGMILAAKLEGTSLKTLAATASFSCACSDGTSIVPLCTARPICSSNTLNIVEVDTTAVYTPMLVYPGVARTITLNGKAQMRVAQ